jgi:hypothetical protein
MIRPSERHDDDSRSTVGLKKYLGEDHDGAGEAFSAYVSVGALCAGSSE